jgi:L-aspartate oxidase
VAAAVLAAGPVAAGPAVALPAPPPGPVTDRAALRRLMTDRVGVLRDGPSLAEAALRLTGPAATVPAPGGRAEWRGRAEWETAGLAQLGAVMADLASRRTESRGGHWRGDHPVHDPAWQVHQLATRAPDGGVTVARVPLGHTTEVPA